MIALVSGGSVLNYKRTRGIPAGAVYIGRASPKYRLRKSKWPTRYGTRDVVIAKYELYLYRGGLVGEIHNLRGLNLVCWCAPEACQGDVLLRLANAGPRRHSQDADDLRVDHVAAQLEEVEQQELTDSYLSDVTERRDRGDG